MQNAGSVSTNRSVPDDGYGTESGSHQKVCQPRLRFYELLIIFIRIWRVPRLRMELILNVKLTQIQNYELFGTMQFKTNTSAAHQNSI